MFERKVKSVKQKNGLFHRTAPSCVRRLLFKLGEAWGIREFTARPRISDISSSLRLSDGIDITIILALSPHRPTFKEKCHPFHTFQWRIMQAVRQAGRQAASRGIEALSSLSSPGKPQPVKRCFRDTSWIWLPSVPLPKCSAWPPSVGAPTLPAQLHWLAQADY